MAPIALAPVRLGAAVLDSQRGHLFGWVPVAFAGGIGVYFALPWEPGLSIWIAVGVLGALLLALSVWWGLRAPLLIAFVALAAGFAIAGARTHGVAAPVLSFRYYGPIEGRIVVIDRSASDKVRLTLDQVVLSGVPPARTPARVRVSLHGPQGFIDPRPGLTIILTGHLDAPRGATEPGGFDFQRHAWFRQLGAVGYTRTPVLALTPPDPDAWRLFIHRTRMAISRAVQDAVPGQAGAFAAAVTTGDRSGMALTTIEDLRRSNLAHLLAISGLHMGMLTGFVFAAMRYGLALWPYAALRWPCHKIGALAALAAGAVYLLLSGGNVATERAFIMVSVMLVAVLFDQRALTLRAVALAALIVLVRRPEELMGPGFQMSFAATAALIAVFAEVRDRSFFGQWPAWARWGAALVLSSAVAGLATAPVAAAHFNRVPHFGLIANVLSVPVMGSVVVPAAVLAAMLAPLGLSGAALWVMEKGTAWILSVAAEVSSWNGAISHVPQPSTAVLPLLALGGAWVILWQGRSRALGFAPMAAAFVVWAGVERPVVLISDTGGLVGWMTAEGRALSKPKGESFAAENWLAHDGDSATQALANARADDAPLAPAGQLWRHETGRGAADRATLACETAEVVITSAVIETTGPGACRLYDKSALARTGPVAVYDDNGTLRFVPAQRIARRPWQRPAD
ncbi:MAG: ComEC/Rec2 family competence protein [Pseudomonadota bacterium]